MSLIEDWKNGKYQKANFKANYEKKYEQTALLKRKKGKLTGTLLGHLNNITFDVEDLYSFDRNFYELFKRDISDLKLTTEAREIANSDEFKIVLNIYMNNGMFDIYDYYNTPLDKDILECLEFLEKEYPKIIAKYATYVNTYSGLYSLHAIAIKLSDFNVESLDFIVKSFYFEDILMIDTFSYEDIDLLRMIENHYYEKVFDRYLSEKMKQRIILRDYMLIKNCKVLPLGEIIESLKSGTDSIYPKMNNLLTIDNVQNYIRLIYFNKRENSENLRVFSHQSDEILKLSYLINENTFIKCFPYDNLLTAFANNILFSLYLPIFGGFIRKNMTNIKELYKVGIDVHDRTEFDRDGKTVKLMKKFCDEYDSKKIDIESNFVEFFSFAKKDETLLRVLGVDKDLKRNPRTTDYPGFLSYEEFEFKGVQFKGKKILAYVWNFCKHYEDISCEKLQSKKEKKNCIVKERENIFESFKFAMENMLAQTIIEGEDINETHLICYGGQLQTLLTNVLQGRYKFNDGTILNLENFSEQSETIENINLIGKYLRPYLSNPRTENSEKFLSGLINYVYDLAISSKIYLNFRTVCFIIFFCLLDGDRVIFSPGESYMELFQDNKLESYKEFLKYDREIFGEDIDIPEEKEEIKESEKEESEEEESEEEEYYYESSSDSDSSDNTIEEDDYENDEEDV